jgi:SNF2 family DNA or RNA helicase
MAVNKTFGKIQMMEGHWKIIEAKPHVCIKLKAVFAKIAKNSIPPFKFRDTPETCNDLLWFMTRYPMEISSDDFDLLQDGKSSHLKTIEEMEAILMPNNLSYIPEVVALNPGEEARPYQITAANLYHKTKRLLLGDDVGLGKTLSGILSFLKPGTLPAIIVVQTHLTRQWKAEIERFTNLQVHIIKGTKPYSLPTAEVYILRYSCLNGWVDIFNEGIFKSCIFDEIQELRRCESKKYTSGSILAESVDFCMGMSATPIYNYGDEIFNILNLLKPGCLGDRYDFLREWATQRGLNHIVKDPIALGTYLRDNYLFLRRTREEVGRELPAINRIIQTVGYDDGEVKKTDQLAKELAMRVLHGTFIERGAAARELDMLLRHDTGVSKAREVAEYVKILLENNEPVLLAGWHRDVYDIWAVHLAEYNPVWYTGTESDVQKERSKQAFINGETNLFIISLRSGIGLDGLQHRCKTVVVGELDWSPQVHHQLIGRVDRDGQEDQVTAIFTVSEYGSDPVIMDLLGLKASQSHAILNPLTAPVQSISDDSRIKLLAQNFLKKDRP